MLVLQRQNKTVRCCGKYVIYAACLLLCKMSMAQNPSASDKFSTTLFDADWRFYRGDVKKADDKNFNDAAWRHLDLPHDWTIEDLPGTNSPFTPTAIGGVSSGFTVGGIGWYRKTFKLSPGQKNKRLVIYFEGVYMNADIWVNGHLIGKNPYGYTSFYFDITDKVDNDKNNVIAVQVKNVDVTSRWYSGSGIYRHVWLKAYQSVHVAVWGTSITTPKVEQSSADINTKTKVLNEGNKLSNVIFTTKIVSPSGKIVATKTSTQSINAAGFFEFDNTTSIKNPVLWSTTTPQLYTCISEIFINGILNHSVKEKFGIRSISFNTTEGFLLNGKSVKLKGACFHHDNGPLGSKSYDAAEVRKVRLLKESGFNAIRCSHNPPAPAFLNACDSLGMLVIDEAFDMWDGIKDAGDYHLFFNEWWQKDIISIVHRDRNHPSIIMWSIGNEIPKMDDASVAATAKRLSDFVHLQDATRPVTAAVNAITEKKDPFFSALDVCGYNYGKLSYELDHQRLPQRVMYATESFPSEAFDYWMKVVDNPYIIGDFVWTGIDYIGEASIGWRGYEQNVNFYPWNLAFCGDIDICGWKRPQSFYRDALWKENQLSIFVKSPTPSFPVNEKKQPWSVWNWDDVLPDWTWKGFADSIMEVNVYSSCDEVELFLNGKSLGRNTTNRSTKFMAKWNVPYTPGELKAVGYTASKVVNNAVLQTANKTSQIKLLTDNTQLKAGAEDLVYVNVELVDEKGTRNPQAEDLIHFSINGPGTIVGVGNAHPISLESFQQPQRKAWKGRCIVIIKPQKKAGKIILNAEADGLKKAALIMLSK